MKQSDTVGAIGAAMAKAQGAMGFSVKDATNPHFNSRYADLASIVEAMRQPFAANGLSYWQSASADGNLVSMTTLVVHASGEWIESDRLTVQARDAAPQAVGSCLTYLRRYQLAGMAGVAPADDDAEAAERPAAPSRVDEPPPWVTEPDTGLAAAARQSAKRVEARDESRGLMVNAIQQKPTKNPAVIKYTVMFSDGREASTIRDRLATLAKQAIDEQRLVAARMEQGKYGVDLLDLVLLTEA
jgi:hypothetical protein